jgi:hypothetical protein
MEMQFLSERRIAELKPIMGVWREHRDRIAELDVVPIGDKPSGRSFTGFAVMNGTRAEYLLLFREVTDSDTGVIKAPITAKDKAELLASNSKGGIKLRDGSIELTLDSPRSYVFMHITH